MSQYLANNPSQFDPKDKTLIFETNSGCFKNQRTQDIFNITAIENTNNRDIVIKLVNDVNQQLLNLTLQEQPVHIKARKNLGGEMGNFYTKYLAFKSDSGEEFFIPSDFTEEKIRYMKKISSTHLELETETTEIQANLNNNTYQSYDDFLNDFTKKIEYSLDKGVDLEINAMNILKKMDIPTPDVSKEKIFYSKDEILNFIEKQIIKVQDGYFKEITSLVSEKFKPYENNTEDAINVKISESSQHPVCKQNLEEILNKILGCSNSNNPQLRSFYINNIQDACKLMISIDIAEKLSKLKLSTFSSMFLKNSMSMYDFFSTLSTQEKNIIDNDIKECKRKTSDMTQSNGHNGYQIQCIPDDFSFLKTLFNPIFTKEIVKITAISMALQSDDIQVNQGNIIIQNKNGNFMLAVIDTGHSFRNSTIYDIDNVNETCLSQGQVKQNINYMLALIANMNEEMQEIFIKTYFKAQLEILIQQKFIEDVNSIDDFNTILRNNPQLAMQKFNNAKEKLRQKYHIIICEQLKSSKLYFNAMKTVTARRLNTNNQDIIKTILQELRLPDEESLDSDIYRNLNQNESFGGGSDKLESKFNQYKDFYRLNGNQNNILYIMQKWAEKLPENHKQELLSAIEVKKTYNPLKLSGMIKRRLHPVEYTTETKNTSYCYNSNDNNSKCNTF